MKILIILMLLSPFLLGEDVLFLTTNGDKAIEVYNVDSNTGNLTIKQKLPLRGKPGNAVLSPDKKFIYVAIKMEKRESAIQTLRIGSDATLSEASLGKTPIFCGFISADNTGNYLFGSHSSKGKISLYKLEKGEYKGQVLSLKTTDSNAHSIKIDRTNQYIYVPHTGANKVYQFTFKNAKFKALKNNYTNGPDINHNFHGPRHLSFHPSEKTLYTSNEKGGGVSAWTQKENGELTLSQTFNTVPNKAHKTITASDIEISPNGRFIYIANRDKTEPEAISGDDSISSFITDPQNGQVIRRTGITPTGRFPRCLKIDSSGKFLYSTGFKSSSVRQFHINQSDGTLREINRIQTGSNPIWICILNKKDLK